jgi:hypothetical protein
MMRWRMIETIPLLPPYTPWCAERYLYLYYFLAFTYQLRLSDSFQPIMCHEKIYFKSGKRNIRLQKSVDWHTCTSLPKGIRNRGEGQHANYLQWGRTLPETWPRWLCVLEIYLLIVVWCCKWYWKSNIHKVKSGVVLTLNLPTTTIVAQPFLMFCWPCIIVT